MKIGELYALLELHAQQFLSGLSDAKGEAKSATDSISDQFDNVAKKVTSAGGGVSGLSGKLRDAGKGMVIGAGIASFNLLQNAVGAAIGKLDEAHEAFLADQQSQVQLAGALERNIPNWAGNTKGAEDYASAQGRLGFADDDVRASLSQLVGVTHDLTQAQDLNTLAQDLARAKNIDLAQATDIVTKAAQGNGKALKGLGVDVAGAKTAADFLAAAEKNVHGAAEQWANTNEGKLAVSNVKVGEAMEKVGAIVDKASQVLIPLLADAFTTLVGTLTDVWDATEPLRVSLAPILSSVFGIISGVIRTFLGLLQKVIDAIATVIRTAKQAIDAVANIPGVGLVSDVAGNVGGAVGGVVGGLGGLVPHFASGTNFAPGGLALLGENGPELARIPGGTQVFDANRTAGMFGGGLSVDHVELHAHGVQNPEQFVRDSLLALKREVSRQSMSLA